MSTGFRSGQDVLQAQQAYQAQQAQQPTTTIQTVANPFGPTPVEQTYTQDAKPSWMSGWFDTPWWGTNASTGQALAQSDLQAKPQTMQVITEQAQPQQQQNVYDPSKNKSLYQKRQDIINQNNPTAVERYMANQWW